MLCQEAQDISNLLMVLDVPVLFVEENKWSDPDIRIQIYNCASAIRIPDTGS
jgi:hypothetical protein